MCADSIFLLGASGQVGGALLTVLHQQHPSLPITVFLRTHALDSAVKSLSNVTILHGDYDNPSGLASLEDAVSEHSIVINAASSMNLAVNQAILRGLQTHKTTTRQNAILIHLSGAGNFSDNSTTGEYHFTAEVAGLALPFTDTDTAAVRLINGAHEPNGASDAAIMASAHQGLMNAYFVCPAGIYGASNNHIGRRASSAEGRQYASAPGVWARYMFSNIAALGFSPQVGCGENVFWTVHVDDVVSLTLLVLAKALQDRDNKVYGPDTVYENFFLAAANRHTGAEIAQLFAQLGPADRELKVRTVGYEDAGLTARYLAGNMLVVGANAGRLGWKARGEGLVETLLSGKGEV